MTRAEALAWQVGCVLAAVLTVVAIELYEVAVDAAVARVRAAWRVRQAR